MRHKPEIIEKSWKLMLVHDYIVYKLTGEVVTDYSNASRTMLLDLSSRSWCDEIAAEFNLDLSLMPDLVNSGEVVGEIRGNVAEKLGIRSNPLVVAGGGTSNALPSHRELLMRGVLSPLPERAHSWWLRLRG